MFEQGCAVGLKAETAIFAETCGLVNVKKWLLHVWRKNQGTATSFNLQEGNFARLSEDTSESCVMSRALIDTRIPGAD